MRLLLIVSVIGFGGPGRHAQATPLPNVWLQMRHHIAPTGPEGKLRLTFQHRRRYTIRVKGLPCESRTAVIDKPVVRVTLRCALA